MLVASVLSQVQTPGATKIFVAGIKPEDQIDPTLEVSGTVVGTINPSGNVLGPEDPSAPTNPPPLPDFFLGPEETNEPFSHTSLPRLENQASALINMLIYKVEVTIKGTDFSPCYENLDWFRPISGVSNGSLSLVETEGFNLDQTFEQGDLVEFTLWTTPFQVGFKSKAFVIGNPIFSVNQEGLNTLKISLGDELALLENSTRNKTKYCGRSPRTAGEAARIYADINGLRTKLYPRGHDLLEGLFNTFLDESPQKFLQNLYTPTNRDVRSLPSTAIGVIPRPPYDPELAQELSWDQVFESQPSFQKFFEPFTRVKNSNEYQVAEPFELKSRSVRQINGDPENTKPWFQGGFTETETTTTTLGDTVIYTKEVTRGYIPTETPPFSETLVNEDPCEVGGFVTELGVINTKIEALKYFRPNLPDQIVNFRVVSKREIWESGLELRERPDGNFDLFDGVLSYQTEEFQNTPQINVDVCQREWIYLQTFSRLERFGFDQDNTYRQLEIRTTSYSVEGTNVNSGIQSFTGVGQRWTQQINSGAWDDANNTWVQQPSQTNENTNPPSSIVIKPLSTDITNFSEFTLDVTIDREPVPLVTPFAYNTAQLDRASERFLRENFGLSKALQVVVPLNNFLELGESVKFTNRKGTTNPYQVWAIEYNCTQREVTKTLTLLRVFED